MNPASSPVQAWAPAPRLESVDLLRGLVMVMMALDHTRDFFHQGALQGMDPLALQTTTVPLYLTRWITHFCAPVFVFLAGTGAFLSIGRGKTRRDLSGFLFTRGLWLIVLELTWVRWFGWNFAINLREHWFLVIWAIGWSMILLAVLVHLPMPAILGFGLALILGHNAFDDVKPQSWGSWSWLWHVLHAGGPFRLDFAPEFRFGAGYPLIPWTGVMAVGFCFGQLMQWEPGRRRRWLLWLGTGLTSAFVLLRLSNWYGNPKPWSVQSDLTHTVLSFLDCHKYPPSLCYLLMTLGPGLLALAWWDSGAPRMLKPILVFGRVPLFYYLLHLPLIHALAVGVEFMRHGRADWLYGNPAAKAPPEAGFGLLGTYLAWAVVLLLLYPVCRWFSELKRRHRNPWLSYL